MIETELSTEQLPSAERFDYWNEACRKALLRSLIGSDAADDYRARARLLDFGALRVARIVLPPSRIHRSAKLIRSHDPEVYHLTFSLNGHQVFAQAGNETDSGAHDLLFYDSSRPFHGAVTAADGGERVTLVVAQFPRALLPFRADSLDRFVATRLSDHEGISGLVIHCLAELSLGTRRHTPAGAARLSAVAVDLVTALGAQLLETGDTVPPESRRQALVIRIRVFIERNLADPALSPATVAAAHHISTSHLHRVFSGQENTSVAAWIRRRRLHRCRRELADPALRAYPVHAVAARWGFGNAAHFSRLFRAEFGLSPRDWRKQAEHDGIGDASARGGYGSARFSRVAFDTL